MPWSGSTSRLSWLPTTGVDVAFADVVGLAVVGPDDGWLDVGRPDVGGLALVTPDGVVEPAAAGARDDVDVAEPGARQAASPTATTSSVAAAPHDRLADAMTPT
jgi:hypothetical protein